MIYSATFRDLAAARRLSLASQARLFAMLTFAGADGLISCWDDKARWNFWRPNTAIQNASTDHNSATIADAAWTPLIFNPPYPDHPSGYNCITGAMMQTARNFFGRDHMTFSVSSSGTGVLLTRNYTRFSDVYRDTIEARLYLSIHFRTPNVQGVRMGRKIANWLSERFFEPRDDWQR